MAYPTLRMLLSLATAATALTGASVSAQVPGSLPGGLKVTKPDARATGESLVKTELLPAAGLLEAGRPFRLAVVFHVEKGWHTYWRNPGDSGSPPTIDFDLPAGFTASAIEFPRPTIMDGHGETTIGYEGDVAFFVTITPPATFATLSPVPIKAVLSWMVCTDRCLLGRRTVSIDVPVAGTPLVVSEDLKTFHARLPIDAASLSIVAALDGREAIVVEGPAADGTSVRFIPDQTPGVRYGETLPAPVIAQGGRFRLRVPIEVRPGDATGKPLRAAGLVTLDPASGPVGPSTEISLSLGGTATSADHPTPPSR